MNFCLISLKNINFFFDFRWKITAKHLKWTIKIEKGPKKCFNQLLGAHSTWKLVKIYNGQSISEKIRLSVSFLDCNCLNMRIFGIVFSEWQVSDPFKGNEQLTKYIIYNLKFWNIFFSCTVDGLPLNEFRVLAEKSTAIPGQFLKAQWQ